MSRYESLRRQLNHSISEHAKLQNEYDRLRQYYDAEVEEHSRDKYELEMKVDELKGKLRAVKENVRARWGIELIGSLICSFVT